MDPRSLVLLSEAEILVLVLSYLSCCSGSTPKHWTCLAPLLLFSLKKKSLFCHSCLGIWVLLWSGVFLDPEPSISSYFSMRDARDIAGTQKNNCCKMEIIQFLLTCWNSIINKIYIAQTSTYVKRILVTDIYLIHFHLNLVVVNFNWHCWVT